MPRGHIRAREGAKGTTYELRVYSREAKRTVTRSHPGPLREAQRALTRFQSEVDGGAYAGPDGTLTGLLAAWQRARASDWAANTAAMYADVCRLHIVPNLGGRKVRTIRPADLDGLYSTLLERGLSPARIHNVHNALSGAFDQAVRWGWVPASPATHARPPRVRRRDIDPPDADEVRRILKVAGETSVSFQALLVLASDTGARRGELVGLRWDDVDLDHGELLISRTRVMAGREVVEKETKTEDSRRRVALNPFTVQALRRLREFQEAGALRVDGAITERSYLFSEDGDGEVPWSPGSVSQRFATVCRKAGVVGVRLHDLRHFVATQLLAGGIDVRTVAGRLGHSNPSVTLSTYAHFVPAKDRTASDFLGQLLGDG